MKTRFYGLILIAGILGFGACKKDSNDNNTSSVAKLHSVSYYQNNALAMSQTIQYNASGKPAKVTFDDSSYSTVTYGTNSVIITDYDASNQISGTYTYTLNNKGLAINELDTWVKKGGKFATMKHPKLSPEGTSSTVFEYDANNYKVKEIYSEGGNTDTTIYMIANGNTISSHVGGSSWYDVANQFFADKTNTIGSENMGITFFGKQDKNLISISTTTYDGGGNTATKSYIFDSKNRVTKESNDASPDSYITYTYTN
jgi:hypothetical protein